MGRKPVHGHCRNGKESREYETWHQMRQRCTNPKHHAYGRYGGRGIGVCERWSESFEAFLEDMGERPAGCSLDRIDNSGNYTPENCRWATQREQARNSSTVVRLTFRGETLTLVEWCERLGLPYGMIQQRIYKSGWSAEKALTTPKLTHRESGGIGGSRRKSA